MARAAISRYSREYFELSPMSTAGIVHRVAMVWVIPLFISTVALDICTAYKYHKLGGEASRAYDALVIAGAMQLLLTVLLSIRGRWGSDVFKWLLFQMLLVFHVLLPNAIITGLWTARLQMDATLVGIPPEFDKATSAAFAFLSATMVLSNLFSSTCAAILFVNSAFFYASSEKDVADRLTPP